MGLNEHQSNIIAIYKQLFQYKHLLSGGADLTFNVSELDEAFLESRFPEIENQLKNAVAFLLGIRIAATDQNSPLPVEKMLSSVEKTYKKDDFWRRLLLDYIEVRQQEDEKQIRQKKQTVQQEGLDLYKKLSNFRKRRKEIISSFAKKLNEEKLPIDATRLFTNYLNMADIDAEEAWKVAITNPAFFAPINTVDKNGKRNLSVSGAKEVNKKAAAAIKKMKA